MIIKTVRIISLGLAFWALHLSYARHHGGGQGHWTGYEAFYAGFDLTDISLIYPTADSVASLTGDDSLYTVYGGGKVRGFLLHAGRHYKGVMGYHGPTPLLIGLSADGKVDGVVLLNNYESPSYIRMIKQDSWLQSWNGMSMEQALNAEVDYVSRATVSCRAIEQTMRTRLSVYLKAESKKRKRSALAWVKDGAAMAVLVFGLLSFFFRRQLKAYRSWLHVASVGVLGLWSGLFLSMDLVGSWALLGANWQAVPLLVAIAALAVLLPLTTNRAFYCQYICPYGALQELAGKIPAPKPSVNPKVFNTLKELPGLLLLAIAGLLFFGMELDLNLAEPFSAFLLEAAPIVVLILAVAFVLLSIFTPKPWCNYFCPTGRLLKLFRTKQR